MDGFPRHGHGARDLVQARPAAFLAGRAAHRLLDLGADVIGRGLVVTPLQARHDAFVGALPLPDPVGTLEMHRHDVRPRAVKDEALLGGGELPPGPVQVNVVVPADVFQLLEGVALLIFGDANGDGALAQRAVGIGDDQRRVELEFVAQPLTGGTGAVRAVERERAWLDFRQADAAHRAGEVFRKEHIAGRLRVRSRGAHHLHDHDPLAQAQRGFDRVGDAADEIAVGRLGVLFGVGDDEAIHDGLDVMELVAIELRDLVELVGFAVHAHAREAQLAHLIEGGTMVPLAPADQRREDLQPRGRRHAEDRVHNLLCALPGHSASTLGTVGHADAGVEQPQVVVNLGDGADGGARIVGDALLINSDRRTEALDGFHVGLVHLAEELPRVGAERLDVASLPLGEDGIERQGGFPGAG